MQEIWKDIKGYEGLYQVSNLGNIKSIRNGIVKKPSILPKGYLQVCLNRDGKLKYTSIHRLVAKTFIPNPNNYPCVNHKDCNPQNNVVSNLEWVTYKENNNYKNHHLKRNIAAVIYYLKRNIAAVIYYLKRDYCDKNDIIELAEKLKEKIANL